MSNSLKLALKIISVILFLGLMVPFYFFLRNNSIADENRLIKKAKDDYYQREFLEAYLNYKTLFDSFYLDDDAALINYGNAGFLSSSILKNGFYGSTNKKAPALPDSALQQLASNSIDIYTVLTTSRQNKIASMAHNQMGYAVIKSKFAVKQSDSILFEALNSFKEALKANPNNDSARYNYELIKKIISFPETAMSSTRALIAQRRYKEAVEFLENAMARDIRLKNQQDFLNRLKSVAGIDTTFRRN